MKITEKDKCRFMAKVAQNSNEAEACWQWEGSRGGKYGSFWFLGNQIMAHRFSHMMFKGKIPKGKVVMHKCDNYLCVNPAHLKAGTHSQNLLDCVAKGRHVTQTKPETLARGSRNGTHTMPETVRRGNNHPKSKLTTKKVLIIRALGAKFVSSYKMSARFNVSPGAIQAVINRKTWRHI